MPPDTVISLPVMNDAAGETSHDTVVAISSGRPTRPSGLLAATSLAPGVAAAISVSITPGETLLTRIPSGPTSPARPRVNVTTAPFVASYGTNPDRPGSDRAATEA